MDGGLRLKREKCAFMQREADFLGHRVDSTGLRPLLNKVEALQKAPAPRNVTELKAYLGLLNYYHRFLPNLSTLLAPLHNLLRKSVKWHWSSEQREAFEKSKQLIQSPEVLVHYDTQKDLILACDASPYGVGAVLSHRMEDGQERPISFMSRTLTPSERNYSQLDKEGLAVIFGIQRFHKYLFGRKFTICTDHKPLISLLSEMKAVPQFVSPRIQRWAVMMQAYEYTIVYKPGKEHSNADALSRCPVPDVSPEACSEDRILMMEDIPLVSAKNVCTWTGKDPILARVRQVVLSGGAYQMDSPEFKPYAARQTELSVQDGCILWGARVIIPPQGRKDVLQQLHQCHPGISRMKALARSYFWWPKLDDDIEALAKSCLTCQEHRKAPATAPLHPWEWPEKPWERIHIDYAGPFLGHMFLILIDAHSKWMDVYPVSTTSSATTIDCLRKSFSNHGLPEMLVSDNAAYFVSTEFKDFMNKNGIKHVTSAPFHASSNGLAERAVQTFKTMMKKAGEGSVATKVARVLFSYRITPQSTTGLSPAEMLLGRKLRSTLDLLHPDLQQKVREKQIKQKQYHDNKWQRRCFQVGDTVLTRNFSYGPKWIPGFITKVTGPLSYQVMLGDGKTVRRHVDQILSQDVRSSESRENVSGDVSLDTSVCSGTATVGGDTVTEPVILGSQNQPETVERQSPITEVRRSQRTVKRPKHLEDFVL